MKSSSTHSPFVMMRTWHIASGSIGPLKPLNHDESVQQLSHAAAALGHALGHGPRTPWAEFRRTHCDEWDVTHRHKFSEEQLLCLSDVRSTADYFT